MFNTSELMKTIHIKYFVIKHNKFKPRFNLIYLIKLSIISKNERKKVKEILTAMNIGIPIGKTTIEFAEQFMKENGGIERYEQELKNQISRPHGFVHVQHIGFNDHGNKVLTSHLLKGFKLFKFINLIKIVSNHQFPNATSQALNNSRKLQREQVVPTSNLIRRINPSDPSIYHRLNTRR